VRTLVLADTHIGTGDSLAIAPECLARLATEFAWADRLVLNGDIFSFGAASVADCLQAAEPLFDLIRCHITEVVYLVGNHDFHFAHTAADARRFAHLTGSTPDPRPLPLAAAVLEAQLPGIAITTAHPSVVVDGVTITHGYQINAHFGKLRSLLDECEYDDLVGPHYECFYALRQGDPRLRQPKIWQYLLNTVGRIAPHPGVLRPVEEVLPTMSTVCQRLGIAPGIVVFGHLHQVIEPIWVGDYCLVNSGGWFYDRFILDNDPDPQSSWPGGVIRITDGQLELRRLLADVSKDELAALAR
jgi:predicted phosphodiesterase